MAKKKNDEGPVPAEEPKGGVSLRAKLIGVAAITALLMIVWIASPWILPATKDLFWNRGTWVALWTLESFGYGDTELAEIAREWRYGYLESTIDVPNIEFSKLETSGSDATFHILITPKRSILIEKAELRRRGQVIQVLAKEVESHRLDRTVEGLPDDEYSFYIRATHFVRVDSLTLGRKTDPFLRQSQWAEESFVIDTKGPQPAGWRAISDPTQRVVVIQGSTQDLSGLQTAQVGNRARVDSEDGQTFVLLVPLRVANRYLRREGTVPLILIDKKGVKTEVEVAVEQPFQGWVRYLNDDRGMDGITRIAPILEIQPLGFEPEGGFRALWGYHPDQTWARFEEGQEVEAFGTDPDWHKWSRFGLTAAVLLVVLSTAVVSKYGRGWLYRFGGWLAAQ